MKRNVSTLGMFLAKPLSHLVANSTTERIVQAAEGFLAVLQGKGAGPLCGLEMEVNAAISTIGHSSPIVFDVGANLGDWSVLFHQRCPQAQLFLFEPQPACQTTILERHIPGSTLIPNAVSSTAGQTIKLFLYDDWNQISSLHPRKESRFKDLNFTSLDVATTTIDEVIQEHKLTRVDFMKMDVEGHELDVLKGAMKSLEGRLIKALSFEFGSGNINSRTFFRDFWDLLKPFGYDIYRIQPSSRLMRINEYKEKSEYFHRGTNYIAKLP